MNSKPTGLLLLAFGGADSMDAIEPFMKNLMGGKTPPPPLVEKIKARYALIGGKSPLPETTAQQAKKLEDYLNSRGGSFKAAVGMRYWHPFIEEGLDSLLKDGIETVIAISMAPFYSEVSTGAYKEELDKAAVAVEGIKPEIYLTDDLFDKPLFIEAVAEKVRESINKFSSEKPVVIFSAHSLPVSLIEKGDPYVKQFEYTAQRVAEMVGLQEWHVAYQSKGGGQGQWLEPTVETVMDELKDQGCNSVLVVPIGFVCDHIETLYDIDIAQKSHAQSIGLEFHRTESLNTSDLFIQALASTVEDKINLK